MGQFLNFHTKSMLRANPGNQPPTYGDLTRIRKYDDTFLKLNPDQFKATLDGSVQFSGHAIGSGGDTFEAGVLWTTNPNFTLRYTSENEQPYLWKAYFTWMNKTSGAGFVAAFPYREASYSYNNAEVQGVSGFLNRREASLWQIAVFFSVVDGPAAFHIDAGLYWLKDSGGAGTEDPRGRYKYEAGQTVELGGNAYDPKWARADYQGDIVIGNV